MACRIEVNRELLTTEETTKQYKIMENSMQQDNPLLEQVLDGAVAYAYLRELPITIIGTSSSGFFANQKSRSPADVLSKHIKYKDLEVQ